MATQELKLSFNHEKDTKNTRRFQEQTEAERPTVGTLYVLSSELEKIGNPDSLEVVIKEKAS